MWDHALRAFLQMQFERGREKYADFAARNDTLVRFPAFGHRVFFAKALFTAPLNSPPKIIVAGIFAPKFSSLDTLHLLRGIIRGLAKNTD